MLARRLAAGGLGVALAAVLGACRESTGDVSAARWSAWTDAAGDLPDGVHVYELDGEELGLRAWYVRLDPRDPALEVRVVAAGDDDRLETVSELVRDSGACVAVNGGFFGDRDGRGNPAGLVLASGTVVKPPWRVTQEDGKEFPLARATLGIDADGRAGIAWVTRAEGRLVEWPAAWPNAPGAPCEPPDPALSRPWAASQAVQGGPNLLRGGARAITADEEVVHGRLRDRQPRTAAGVTASGELVLLVVDGNQSASRGVDLEELATLLQGVGCVDALNLDGGGSSTLVVGGKLVNRPEDGDEREVADAVVVVPRPPGGIDASR